ncbi:MAG: glycosyltransferase [Bryobacteraceae bacterium]
MRVVHVGKYYPPRWGGMETAVQDLCETTARWAEVEAVVAHRGPRTLREERNGVRVTRLAAPAVLLSQPLTWTLPGYLRGIRADLLHIHEPNPIAVASWLASRGRGRPIPAIIHYHSDVVRQKTAMRFYRPLQQRGLARAAAIVAGSGELIESSTELSAWRDKCEVIPFGIRLDPFLQLQRIPSQVPCILAVGRLSYYKGFQYLIEAMRGLEARLVIVGEGEMRAELEARIRECGVGDSVRLAGRVDEASLLDYYRRADVFCLSSCERSEAFGLVQLEAMGAGLPIVSTDLPTGVRAINVDGVTGLVAPPHDAPALGLALARLCADAGLRRRMGEAGRRRAMACFSREVMGRRIEALYARVLREAGHAAAIPQTMGVSGAGASGGGWRVGEMVAKEAQR